MSVKRWHFKIIQKNCVQIDDICSCHKLKFCLQPLLLYYEKVNIYMHTTLFFKHNTKFFGRFQSEGSRMRKKIKLITVLTGLLFIPHGTCVLFPLKHAYLMKTETMSEELEFFSCHFYALFTNGISCPASFSMYLFVVFSFLWPIFVLFFLQTQLSCRKPLYGVKYVWQPRNTDSGYSKYHVTMW